MINVLSPDYLRLIKIQSVVYFCKTTFINFEIQVKIKNRFIFPTLSTNPNTLKE